MVTVPGQELHPEVKSIKIVTGKGCLEEWQQLKVMAVFSFSVVADSEITDKYASLLYRTLGNSPEFLQTREPQVLYPSHTPVPNSQNSPSVLPVGQAETGSAERKKPTPRTK